MKLGEDVNFWFDVATRVQKRVPARVEGRFPFFLSFFLFFSSFSFPNNRIRSRCSRMRSLVSKQRSVSLDAFQILHTRPILIPINAETNVLLSRHMRQSVHISINGST